MKIPAFIINGLNSYFRFVVGGAVGLVLIFGYVLLLAPKVTSVQTSQLSAQKTAEADLQSKQGHAAALRRSNAQFQQAFPAERLKTINDFLPDAPDFPRLLLLVKSLVSQSQLTLNNFSLTNAQSSSPAATPTAPGASPSVSEVKSADMAISVSGGSTYESFKNLLANLENSKPLLDVVTLTFSAAPPQAAGGVQTGITVVWTFTLRTYYLPKT